MSKITLAPNATGNAIFTVAAPATATDRTLTLPDATGTLGLMQLGTPVGAGSGTVIDFLDIPSWVNRVSVVLAGVSLSGTANLLIQLGTSSGVEITGYESSSALAGAAVDAGAATSTAGIIIRAGANTAKVSGIIQFIRGNGTLWMAGGGYARIDAALSGAAGGSKLLGGTLDRIRLTSTTGTDTFDSGIVNIFWEG